jgi:hypothetical protein
LYTGLGLGRRYFDNLFGRYPLHREGLHSKAKEGTFDRMDHILDALKDFDGENELVALACECEERSIVSPCAP